MPYTNVFSVACPTDCSALTLPALVVDQDCTAYELIESQVSGVFLVPDDREGPTDWTQAAGWTVVLNNSMVGEAKYLVGIGGVAEAEKETVELPKGRDRTVRRDYTLTLRVTNLQDIQYEFLRALQCGDTSFHFWIETTGGHLFGGPVGIRPSSVDADLPLGSERTSLEEGVVTIRWTARTDADRTAWDGVTDYNSGGSGGVVFAPVVGDDSVVFGPVEGDDSVVFGPNDGQEITYSA